MKQKDKPMKIQTEILGQQITVQVSRLGDFQCVEMEKVVLPEDLESGKAIEEVYASLQEVLTKEYSLGEDYLFFTTPPDGQYCVTAVRADHLPAEVAAHPENFWYNRTEDEWFKIN